MRKLFLPKFMILLFCIHLVPLAVAESRTIYEGKDITSVVELFRKNSKLVKHPFYLYHWGGSKELKESPDAQKNPAKYGRAFLKNTSKGFLGGLSQPSRSGSSMMGPGLYAAIDPTSTEDFADSEFWSLLEMRIPIGFRVIDLAKTSTVDSGANNLLSGFHCPTSSNNYTTSIEAIFQADQLYPDCVDLIRHVLTSLEIDGFTYSYSSDAYHECVNVDGYNLGRLAAFVIISDRWADLPGAEVQIYSSNTTDLSSHRAHIESVFYTAGKMKFDDFMIKHDYDSIFARDLLLKVAKDRFPNLDSSLYLRSVRPNDCRRGTDCLTLELGYYDYTKNDWQYISLELSSAEIPRLDPEQARYPKKINAKVPPLSKEALHWTDLNGRSTLVDIKGWMQRNLYNCGPDDYLGPAGVL